MASSDRERGVPDGGSGGLRDRSSTFSVGQRPQPKPRRLIPTRTSSVRQKRNVQEATSVSADSSPQLSKDIKSQQILQPTPLVLALRNQLIGQIAEKDQLHPQVLADNQQQDSTEEGWANEDKVSPDVRKETETRALPSDSLTMAPQTNETNEKSSQFHSKTSSVIQRQRAVSEPKTRPSRPSRPPHPPTPNPVLSRLINESQTSQHSTHVIDSRTKTLPTRHSDTGKTTKYGTPPPRRPAPPPPQQKKATPTEQVTPKSQNMPVPKPRNFPIPKPRNSASLSFSKIQTADREMTSKTTKEAVDKDLQYPIYEDLDQDEDNYEILVRISSSEDKDDLVATCEIDQQNFTGEIPPPLPPKDGSEVTNENEELPPLPPRSLPATNVRSHHVFTDCRGYDVIVRGEGKVQEPIQDLGIYEPVNFYASDEESDADESQRSYTEMNDPSHQTSDDSLENDGPEDIYITMNPTEYIPPPKDYKSKKKQSLNNGGNGRLRDRSSTFSAGQRPDPKPRRLTPTRSHLILQPTPLVLALRNQLIGQIAEKDQLHSQALPNNQQQDSAEEVWTNEDKVSPDVKKDTETKHERDLPSDSLTMSPQTNEKSSQFHPKTSSVIRRQRAVSEPKARPSKPPRPPYPPSPSPMLSRLINESRTSQHRTHVIDSRSKTLPTRHSDTGKKTKYGTPTPRRPAPPPPQKKATPTQQAAPKPQNIYMPVPQPRSLPFPKSQSLTSLSSSKPQNTDKELKTTKEAVDKVYPVYEDLDKDVDDDETLLQISPSEETDGLTETCEKDEQDFDGEIPPPLPPRDGSEVMKEDEKAPPRPPRPLPATNTRRHRVFTDCQGYDILKLIVGREEKEQEPVQDDGIYEPIIFRGSDEESDADESQRSYTEMNDPSHQSSESDDSLENDDPEDIYITMNPTEYIPPPKDYKMKKKQSLNSESNS